MSIYDNIWMVRKNMEKIIIAGAVASAVIATATYLITIGLK
jgi:hypothetical protein